jgi:3-isopropylmalate dehydrogenase
VIRIAVIPGDGIGPEVTQQALAVLDALRLDIGMDVLDQVNAGRFLRTQTTLTDAEMARIRAANAVFLGAVGDPRVTDARYARGVILRLRFDLDLYVNYRPVTLYHERLSPLRDSHRRGVDCVVIRENTEGLYSGIGGVLRAGTDNELAIDEEISTYLGVSRVLDYAFSSARTDVCMVDKSNAVPNGGRLWQRCWKAAAASHPDMPTRHLYIDAAVAKLVDDPSSFDVIVTNNSYGDILSDLAAQIAGGLGTAASANINPLTEAGLYEPIHGSAPDIAGRGIANPIAAISSMALLIERHGYHVEALAIRKAIGSAIAAMRCTPDLGGRLTTDQAGAAIRAALT